jgi:hypothetical protein
MDGGKQGGIERMTTVMLSNEAEGGKRNGQGKAPHFSLKLVLGGGGWWWWWCAVKTHPDTTAIGVVHANLGQKLLICYLVRVFRSFSLSGFISVTQLLCEATDFSN